MCVCVCDVVIIIVIIEEYSRAVTCSAHLIPTASSQQAFSFKCDCIIIILRCLVGCDNDNGFLAAFVIAANLDPEVISARVSKTLEAVLQRAIRLLRMTEEEKGRHKHNTLQQLLIVTNRLQIDSAQCEIRVALRENKAPIVNMGIL